MLRLFMALSLASLAFHTLQTSPLLAQQQRAAPANAPAQQQAKPGTQPAQLLQSFSDWGAYASQGSGRSRVCYALSQPKDRLPKGLNRDPAYLFVSTKPAENVRNEISIILGFPAKDGADAQATIGTTNFALVTQGGSAWIKNPAEEARFLDAMRKGERLVIKASSKRGNALSDVYSLKGSADAIECAVAKCQNPNAKCE